MVEEIKNALFKTPMNNRSEEDNLELASQELEAGLGSR